MQEKGMTDQDTRVGALSNSSQADGERPTFRQWTHTVLEEGQIDTLPGRVVEALLVVLIIANVTAVALETIPSVYGKFGALFSAFEQFSLFAYALEYIARLWSSIEDPRIAVRGPLHGRVAFALRPLMIVDFLAFAPSILGLFLGFDFRVLRIFRLFRLLKLARYSQALQALLSVLLAERSALFASALLLVATTCFFGELMHLAEGAIQPRLLGTMPGGMYWAITTLATVGYGDITPVTPVGKFIAGLTMVTGLALFALPVGIIANGFVTGLSRRRFAITWTMLRRQPLFRGFDVHALNAILEVLSAVVVREHSHITVAGRHADMFYLVVSGRACFESGEIVKEIGAGGMIGVEAYVHQGLYGETVIAETDLRVAALPGDELRRLCRKFPLLRERIEAALAEHRHHAPTGDPLSRIRELEKENLRLRRALSELANGTAPIVQADSATPTQ
jgi:voltage-gated potassium channel